MHPPAYTLNPRTNHAGVLPKTSLWLEISCKQPQAHPCPLEEAVEIWSCPLQTKDSTTQVAPAKWATSWAQTNPTKIKKYAIPSVGFLNPQKFVFVRLPLISGSGIRPWHWVSTIPYCFLSEAAQFKLLGTSQTTRGSTDYSRDTGPATSKWIKWICPYALLMFIFHYLHLTFNIVTCCWKMRILYRSLQSRHCHSLPWRLPSRDRNSLAPDAQSNQLLDSSGTVLQQGAMVPQLS